MKENIEERTENNVIEMIFREKFAIYIETLVN